MSTSDPPASPLALTTRLIAQLQQLQAAATEPNLTAQSLQPQVTSLQQLYQQQLLPALIASPAASTLVTYQTEINRALRLLGMDATFLRSAKTPQTQAKRLVQLQDRLRILLEFSQGLQAELGGEDRGAES